MLKTLMNMMVFLCIGILLLSLCNDTGHMLVVEYFGILAAIVACFSMALINAALLVYDLEEY